MVAPSSVKEAAILSTEISATEKCQQFHDTPTLKRIFVVRFAKISVFPIS